MKNYLLISLIGIIHLFMQSVNAQATSYETACMQQFSKLCKDIRRTNLVRDSLYKQEDLHHYETLKQKDSTTFNKLFQNYFVAIILDGRNVFGKNEIAKLDQEVREFTRFVSDTSYGRLEDLSIKPIRYSKNSFMLSKLDTYQIDRSFIMFDKTKPENEIMYLFFLDPKYEGMRDVPKILAVKMAYAYNGAYFIDLLGQMGTEIYFEGPKPPKHLIQL